MINIEVQLCMNAESLEYERIISFLKILFETYVDDVLDQI